MQNSLTPTSNCDQLFTPIFQVSIKKRESHKLILKPAFNLQSSSRIPTSQKTRLKEPQISYSALSTTSTSFTSSKSSTTTPVKDLRIYLNKLNPVITSNLNSSYRRSSRTFVSNNDIHSPKQKKQVLLAKNIYIIGRNCVGSSRVIKKYYN